MQKTEAEILSNTKIASRLYRMVLDAPSIAGQARPGQFLHVRCSGSYDPLLRRPFSVHRINGSSVGILYQVVGKGTEILSQRKAGEELSMLGPLGNGFSIGEAIDTAILVAGGIGIAPLVCLAEKLVPGSQSPPKADQPSADPVPGKSKRVYALIGAKTKELVLYEREFKELGIEVRVSTEDGSYGRKGLVTDLLKDFLLSRPHGKGEGWYISGPMPMLKGLAEILRPYNISAQASLEERMGCGVGACLGCVVKIKRPEARGQKSDLRTPPSQAFIYKRVCTDGPIFWLDEVVWSRN